MPPAPPSPVAPPADGVRALVARLTSPAFLKDRGKMVALRAWWSPARRFDAYPVLAELLGAKALDRPAWIALPALFALHGRHKELAPPRRHNLGTTCREVAGAKGREAFAPHLRRLLACDDLESGLLPVLRRLVQRADASGAGINFHQLGWDLRRWEHHSADIKTAWAMEYFRDPDEAEEEAAAAA